MTQGISHTTQFHAQHIKVGEVGERWGGCLDWWHLPAQVSITHDGNLLSWGGWTLAHRKLWINSLVLLCLWVSFALPIELFLAQPVSFLTFMILSLHLIGQVTDWLCGFGVKYWHKQMAYSNPSPQIQRGLKCSYFYIYSSDIPVFCVHALAIRIAFAPLLYLFLYIIWKWAWLVHSTWQGWFGWGYFKPNFLSQYQEHTRGKCLSQL